MKKLYVCKKGVTLIEVMISITLFSIIMISLTTYFLGIINNCNSQMEILKMKQNVRFALNQIDKILRECNQQEIIYYDNMKKFELKNNKDDTVFVDLSGIQQNKFNTILYFNKDKRQLRINKKGEHNVLIDYIKDISIKEIIDNKLIEIEVFSDKIDYSVKMRLNLSER
ncbi:PilW family protein [Crassaminicella thermophila]|uniref:PilW family protein n=1 Tax=Crassaminicella thermophila TaxID=2599308 RepID=UPI00143D953C|nr:prepilin-type N-terminal cleavage/methylation domain-containing protein [Crassaminicella thermophila]